MTDIMSSMVPPLLDCKCTGTVAEYEHCQRMSQWILTGLIVALAFPLSLLRKLTALRFTSMLSVVSMHFSPACFATSRWMITSGTRPAAAEGNSSSTPDDRRAMMRMNDACMAKHPHSRLDCLVWYRFSMRDFPLTLPVLSASFMMHFNVLPARAELRKPTAERMRRSHSVHDCPRGSAVPDCRCGWLSRLAGPAAEPCRKAIFSTSTRMTIQSSRLGASASWGPCTCRFLS